MPMPITDLEAALREGFPDSEIQVEDLAGDGDHYRARIVSKAFSGLSRVKQHQLVYAALKGKMGGELHALALETQAPG
ncbi:MAG: BolA family transcriptional regulator [Phenylobacterium sp.]|uniref:BolA family transcriptional regulator n=1 Tax=Phenylobacterium ferrooxidans TaxID=2982689 RepID=A0ABW6CQL2_9CAUL|nr:BolA family transcriptional regulator [Phenylobacterium sp.]MDO8324367.1 BolA family transcriptional regulator [Phenylobacterium sp.]MDO8913859.1 BolA family transcriptional regulator [Phenylobacterium sp.]MDO9244967.1 BolA family transcriptional regulator [Phenylobacterium sp.]MDP2012536.1 BolA family transcriptional regulator [Phenylobacterium sp.]MDP3100458.1 BolA family transcriptional regulator [Phenylobacterium sp.]